MIPSVKFLFILNQYFVILLSKNMGNEISFLFYPCLEPVLRFQVINDKIVKVKI